MQTTRLLACALAGSLSLAGARAATLIPITPPPDGSSALVFGINDSGVIVGSYVRASDGLERGFFGPLNGDYQTFDAGEGGTRALAINNASMTTGRCPANGGTKTPMGSCTIWRRMRSPIFL